MRKPVVDYRTFRLSKINDAQFSHLKYLLGWVGYFVMYILTENFIPRENCYVIHSAVDDMIPFCEVFVVPYVFWYALVAGSLLWFAFYNTEGFKNLSKYIIITQIIAMTVYIVFPNCQNLRPEFFTRDNIFTKIIGLIYTVDTSTNVFPSLHVGYSLGILSVWLREKSASKGVKTFVTITVLLVCMSVTFIKQHSFADVLAAIPMCLIAEYIVFYRRRKK